MKLILLILASGAYYLRQPLQIKRIKSSIAVPLKSDDAEIIVKRPSDAASIVSLLAMTLATGLSVEDSFALCATHGPASMQQDFARIYEQLTNGLTTNQVLQSLVLKHPELDVAIQLLSTAQESGSECANSLTLISLHMYEQIHHDFVRKLRSLSVRSVIPLGVCFLPAFILLAIVPLTVSMFGHL